MNGEGMELIGMSLLDRLISVTILTGWLKDENPISLMIVAPPAHSKTHILLQYSECKGVIYLTDFTPYGFMRDHFADIESGKRRFLLVPDLNILFSDPMSRSKIVGLLLELIEHGVLNISKYWKEADKFGITSKKVKCGMICATTLNVIRDKRKKWLHDSGFLSRFLVFSYSYGKDLLERILRKLWEGRPKIIPKELPIPDEDVEVECSPKFFEKDLDPLIREVARKQGSEYIAIRITNHVRTLLKANALLNERTEVTEEDVIDVYSYLVYMNYDLKPLKPFEEVREEAERNLQLNRIL